MTAPTREEISSAIVRRWPSMTRADLARVQAAIDEHVLEQDVALTSVATTSTYTAVWGRHRNPRWRHRAPRVIAYVHLGFVALPNPEPATGWYVVKLSNYEDASEYGERHDVSRARCADCNAQLPIAGDECGVCGLPVS